LEGGVGLGGDLSLGLSSLAYKVSNSTNRKNTDGYILKEMANRKNSISSSMS
jgi:hypothetical protein